MLKDLHIWLAILTTLTVLAATIEGAVRAIRAVPAGSTAWRTLLGVLTSVLLTVLVGLALLITGQRPKEWLHLLYAALAFGLIPFADNAGQSLRTDRGKGLYRFAGGILCLLILTRLFVTGQN
jgi:Na+-transporting NADH:ubiquinone oxidoreductase subunit NqrB